MERYRESSKAESAFNGYALPQETAVRDFVESSEYSKFLPNSILPGIQHNSIYNFTSSVHLLLCSIENELRKDESMITILYDIHLKGNIAQISQSQPGSLFLQKHVDKLPNEIIASLYTEVRFYF